MIQEYLGALGSSAHLASIILIVFFALFLGIVWQTYKISPLEIERMRQIPIQKDE